MNLIFSIFLKGGGGKAPSLVWQGGPKFSKGGAWPPLGVAVQNHASKERAGGRKSNLGHDQIIVSEIVCISICERAGFKCAVCVCRGGGVKESFTIG